MKFICVQNDENLDSSKSDLKCKEKFKHLLLFAIEGNTFLSNLHRHT